MDKYNPEQFEIIGFSLEIAASMREFVKKGECMGGGKRFYVAYPDSKDAERGYKYHRCYDRIAIRHKRPKTEGRT